MWYGLAVQTVFKRYELKYALTLEQKALLLAAMEPYMRRDRYGRCTIRNLYYDTERFRLARQSNEKPVYKEKLRVRSYGAAAPTDPVFVELKKKYRSVVYKRRLSLPEREATAWLAEDTPPRTPSQIASEIEAFRNYYGRLRPVVFLSYEREAFYALDGSDFRVTFDENILARTDGLSLDQGVGGTPLRDTRSVLMEVKTSGAIPLWMTAFLTEQEIYKTSFSKYGTAYRELIRKGVLQNAAFSRTV